MTTLYAQPYNPDATGFYFDSYEDFEEKAEDLKDSYGNPVEEFEIQYIDGDNPSLFKACEIGQADLDEWFSDFDHVDDDDDDAAVALIWLLDDLGYDKADALMKSDDVCVFYGSDEDYAYDFFNECYEIPEHLKHYIDYAAIARDMTIEGSISEIGCNQYVTNAYDF